MIARVRHLARLVATCIVCKSIWIYHFCVYTGKIIFLYVICLNSFFNYIKRIMVYFLPKRIELYSIEHMNSIRQLDAGNLQRSLHVSSENIFQTTKN